MAIVFDAGSSEQRLITPFEHLNMRFVLSKYKINDFQTNVMIEINKNERFFVLVFF